MNAIERKAIEDILRTAGPMFDGGNDESRHRIVQEWAELFETSEVKRWIDAGCWDAMTASDLRDSGHDPKTDKLRYREGFGRDDMDPMYALCNGDTSLDKLEF